MKRYFLAIASIAALVLALTFPVAVPAAPPAPQPHPAAAAPERHPEIHDAIAALRSSREHLQHANHDFGGHRVEAIRSIDEALRQLQLCLEFDK